jgi:hypothetical protein
MDSTNLTFEGFWKKNRFSILVFVILSLSFLIYSSFRIIQAKQVEGQWDVFDSKNFITGRNNPDGFQIDYPKHWISGAYDEGGEKNLGDLRARFSDPYFLFSPTTYVSIWWRRVDDEWTLHDVKEWYIHDLGFNINRDQLAEKSDSFREITVGKGNYRATNQVFWKNGNSDIRIVLVLVGDEAFALQLVTPNLNDTDTQETFNRMLDSLEIYK